MADPNDPKQSIVVVLEKTLETINAIFEQNSVDLPSRQYIAMGGVGDAAYDCEQLTVSFEQLYPGLPGAQETEPHKCASPRTVGIVVELVRCIPAPTMDRNRRPVLPTPEEQDATARVQAIDAWLLLEAGLTVAQEQLLYGGLADVSSGPPSGKYQAVIMNLTIGA